MDDGASSVAESELALESELAREFEKNDPLDHGLRLPAYSPRPTTPPAPARAPVPQWLDGAAMPALARVMSARGYSPRTELDL